MGLRLINAPLDHQIRMAVWTEDPIAPSQIAYGFKTLGVINQMLDIDDGENPDRKEEEPRHNIKNTTLDLPFQVISLESR